MASRGQRRQTLSNVGGRFNRASFGGSGGSSAANNSKKLMRASIAGGVRPSLGGSRRMSGIGAGAGAGAENSQMMSHRHSYQPTTTGGSRRKKEAHPWDMPDFTSHAVDVLMTFLAQKKFKEPLSRKILSKPTDKLFFDILTSLLRLVDPRFKFSSERKKKDEVIAVFKQLGYPFTITKANLTTVASLHNWPPLLAALVWLVELLSMDERAQDEQLAELETMKRTGVHEAVDENKAQKLFYSIVSNMYEKFMCGEDDDVAGIDNDTRIQFENMNEALLQDKEAVEEEAKALAGQIEELSNPAATLAGVSEHMSLLQHDKKKFSTTVERLQANNQELAAKQDTKIAAKQELEAELAHGQETIANLKKRIARQEVSAADAKRMAQEKAMIKESLERACAAKEKSNNDVWEMDMELKRKMDALQVSVQQFRNESTRLHLNGPNSKYANGIDYNLTLDVEGAANGAPLIVTDVSAVKEGLRELKDQFVRKTQEARADNFELTDEVEECNEARKDKDREVEKLKHHLNKLNESLKRERADLERTIAAKNEEVEELETEIARTRQTMLDEETDDVEFGSGSIATMEADLARDMKSMEAERAAMRARIVTAVRSLEAHKKSIQQQLEACRKTVHAEYKAAKELSEEATA